MDIAREGKGSFGVSSIEAIELAGRLVGPPNIRQAGDLYSLKRERERLTLDNLSCVASAATVNTAALCAMSPCVCVTYEFSFGPHPHLFIYLFMRHL